jgi:hypothetical protein
VRQRTRIYSTRVATHTQVRGVADDLFAGDCVRAVTHLVGMLQSQIRDKHFRLVEENMTAHAGSPILDPLCFPQPIDSAGACFCSSSTTTTTKHPQQQGEEEKEGEEEEEEEEEEEAETQQLYLLSGDDEYDQFYDDDHDNGGSDALQVRDYREDGDALRAQLKERLMVNKKQKKNKKKKKKLHVGDEVEVRPGRRLLRDQDNDDNDEVGRCLSVE